MNETKKKLLAEIDRKIARKKEMAASALERRTIDAFVVAYISNIEDIDALTQDYVAWGQLANAAQLTLLQQLRSYDDQCKIEVKWNHSDEGKVKVNGVLIKWSAAHHTKMGIEPELFVDIMSLIFAD